MTVTVKALTEVQHGYLRGRLDAVTGGTYKLPDGEAKALADAGFVEIVTEAPVADLAPQTGVTDSQTEVTDDLLGDGDTKAAPEAENKMAAAPSNKSKK